MREGSGTKSRRSSPRTDGLGTHPFCMPGRRVDRRTRSLRRRTKIPRYARILIIFFSCGGMSCSCQWYRVCDAGALRAEPLATLMSCAVKIARRNRCNNVCRTVLPPSLGCEGLSLFPSCPFSFFLPSPLSLIYPAQLIPARLGCTFINRVVVFDSFMERQERIQLTTTLSHSRQARARKKEFYNKSRSHTHD